VSACCGEDLRIITKGGGLAIHFRGEAHSFVYFADMVEESVAEKLLSPLQRVMCLGITGAMRSTPTSALEV
jgi:hypothetical protein